MYVVKIMRSGHALRISIPRYLQRHLNVRAGDFLRLDSVDGAGVRVRKLEFQELKDATIPRDTSDPA